MVLNNHPATNNCFAGLCFLDNFAEACPFLYFLMMTSLISIGLVGVWRTVPPPGFWVWTCHSLMQAHTYGTRWAMVDGVFFSTSRKAVLVSLSPPEAMPSLTMVWEVKVGAESWTHQRGPSSCNPVATGGHTQYSEIWKVEGQVTTDFAYMR